jgi:ribonuclease HI
MAARPNPAAHDAVLAELIELEHLLLDPKVRADAEQVRALLHPDFEEIGASGRHWHRDAIVDSLHDQPGHGSETSQVDATFLAPNVVLITYAAMSRGPDHAISRRSSIWTHERGRWGIRYHQGTPVD